MWCKIKLIKKKIYKPILLRFNQERKITRKKLLRKGEKEIETEINQNVYAVNLIEIFVEKFSEKSVRNISLHLFI